MENTDYVKLVVEAKDNKAALEKLLELFTQTSHIDFAYAP